MIRIDLPDQIFKTKAAKYRAVVRNAVERHKVGQPLLIGKLHLLHNLKNFPDMLLRAEFPHRCIEC